MVGSLTPEHRETAVATIGTAIESGSMQTVLLEPTSGEVLAHSTTPLDPDVTARSLQGILASGEYVPSRKSTYESRDLITDALKERMEAIT